MVPYITVVLACRLILNLRHAYYQPVLMGDSRMGFAMSSMGLQNE